MGQEFPSGRAFKKQSSVISFMIKVHYTSDTRRMNYKVKILKFLFVVKCRFLEASRGTNIDSRKSGGGGGGSVALQCATEQNKQLREKGIWIWFQLS